MKYALLTLLLVIATTATATPSATYKGGYYYLYVNDQRIDQHYTQDYTAKAAAVNESFRCNCEVVIEQPAIVVNTQSGDENQNTATITWTAPTKREDGTALPSTEIAGYILHEESANGEQRYQLTISDIPPGDYGYNIQTVDTDGLAGKLSETVRKVQE